MKLIYCDYIAHAIHAVLVEHSKDVYNERYIDHVSSVKYNLGAFGELKDTKKMVFVTDTFGTEYQITVEEIIK
jgi:hypothetical protein